MQHPQGVYYRIYGSFMLCGIRGGLHVDLSDFIHRGGHNTTSIRQHYVTGSTNHIKLSKGLITSISTRERVNCSPASLFFKQLTKLQAKYTCSFTPRMVSVKFMLGWQIYTEIFLPPPQVIGGGQKWYFI